MRFRKPPVVAVWISCQFDPNPNKREWDLNLVKQYALQYGSEFPKLEVASQQQLQIEETSPADLPRVVERRVRIQSVRLWNEAKTRMLEIGEDRLSCHLLRTPDEEQAEDSVPRYGRVREAIKGKLGDYLREFQPDQIRFATLHYRDSIDIPLPPNGEIELTDYFTLSVDTPADPFGTMSGVIHQFEFNPAGEVGPLHLEFRSMPSPPEDNVARFQMEWHQQSSRIDSLDLTVALSRLQIAHDSIRRCFRAAFHPRTIDLFEPIHESE